MNISLEGLHSYAFCPVSLIPQVTQEEPPSGAESSRLYQGGQGCLGFGKFFSKTFIVGESVDSAIQQQVL